MLITYLLAVIANVLNILFIIFDKRLHKPMYILICNLAVVDILYCCSTTPTMIGVLLAGVNTISYVECFIQMSVFHLVGVMELFALAIMAFDRLIAFSFPFQDKKKMASTCVSHLIVVTCYYSPLFVLIVFTRVGVVLTLEERQGLLIGTILSPSLVNPVVYCFRTKEIKNKIFKIFTKKADILN
ncbi:olfactory receptor 10G4-like [Simochromis diagramma]|uniref:olfactory receptor 10G4-like n=1 Tax=Simochromis diagramma TaxID=43689 RepID=UPI001A7E75C9|nr:olfactory receptor 10G4-like [Simochromis diagramma]